MMDKCKNGNCVDYSQDCENNCQSFIDIGSCDNETGETIPTSEVIKLLEGLRDAMCDLCGGTGTEIIDKEKHVCITCGGTGRVVSKREITRTINTIQKGDDDA
jgi:DnaJ-class molecular chaperone